MTKETNCFDKYDLTIFNRWGNKIFTSTDPELGWDGKHDSKNANSDVYVYILKLNVLSYTF